MKILKFYADWCGPCKMLSAQMEKMDFPHEVQNINIDEDSETPAKYGVRGVPTMLLVDEEGTVQESLVGAVQLSVLEEKLGATKKG